MHTGNQQYQTIATRTLEFIGQHLSEPLPVNRLARNAGYSESRFKVIIKQVTGKSILAHILSMRMDRAQRLLQNTNQSISEIAFGTGFGSHEQFCRTFKKKTGLSPSEFRHVGRKMEGESTPIAEKPTNVPQEWLCQKFHGEEPGETWTLRSGHLERQSDAATGISRDEEFLLICNQPLPENFEVRIDVELRKISGEAPTNFFIAIMDDAGAARCYQIVLGDYDKQVCLLRYWGVEQRICEEPPVKANTWQSLRLRMFDDTISAFLDEQRLLEFRNDFSPSYHQRSRIALGIWRSRGRFRNFVLSDLGFPSLIRPVRQGDALYVAGLFDAARDFYGRILDSQVSFGDTQELYYKIGRCHVATGSLGQSRAWLDKVVSLPENDFWAQQARLQKLYIDLLEQRESAINDMRNLFANPLLRDETRVLIYQVVQRFEQEGRFRICAQLWEFLVGLEERDSLAMLNSQRQGIESLLWLNRYSTAESSLRSILASDRSSWQRRLEALDNLAFVLTMQGRFAESEQCLSRIMEISQEPSAHANAVIHNARNPRGRGRPAEALDMLKQVHQKFSRLNAFRAYAGLEASLLWCSLNNSQEAMNAIKQAEELHPGLDLLSAGSGGTYRYVPLLLLERFGEAAQMLETDSRADGNRIFVRAAHLLKASLLWHLDNKENKARKALEEIVRRFPERRCHYMAALALNLLRGEWQCLKDIPSSAYHRSEIFYLAALALEKQDRAAAANEFLKMSVTEDPSRRWPAYLAEQKQAAERQGNQPQRMER